MSIIITNNGKGAVKLDKSSFAEEGKLQKFILENPDSIPLYDIKEDIRLLILCPEFPTKTGPIDLLATDQEGEIYVIETKLYKNPDKRLVIAQVLDYGTSLWRDSYDFEAFVDRANSIIQEKFNTDLKGRLRDFLEFGDEDVAEVIRKMKINLQDGNIKFVILMDQLHEQLKSIVVFLNEKSNFSIYPVQLEQYNHKDMEITVPKIHCTEAKKDRPQSKTERIPTDDEIIESYAGDPIAKQKIKDILDFVIKLNSGEKTMADFQAHKTGKTISFSIRPGNIERTWVGLTIKPQKNCIDFWVNIKYKETVKDIAIANLPGIESENKKTKDTGGIIARWPLQHFSLKAFEAFIEAVKAAYTN
ncbi:MAG: hypothetical protein WCP43_02035 [Dehalococcoidia bacterium]